MGIEPHISYIPSKTLPVLFYIGKLISLFVIIDLRRFGPKHHFQGLHRSNLVLKHLKKKKKKKTQ